MRRSRLRFVRLAFGVLALCIAVPALADDGHVHARPAVVASAAWVRAIAPQGTVTAGYLIVTNPTGTAVDIVDVESPDFAIVEIHLSAIADGVATMARQGKVTIPANGRLEFKPGGHHLMLMKPRHPVAAGQAVTIELIAADGSRVSVMASVQKQATTTASDVDPHASHGHRQH